MSEWVPGVRGLFQQRVAGDDALLRLTALRVAQAGMPAEPYADTPERLDRLLGFVPEHPTPPVVHLNRGVGLLDAGGRQTIREFAQASPGASVVWSSATRRSCGHRFPRSSPPSARWATVRTGR